jgi:hypothetical protein
MFGALNRFISRLDSDGPSQSSREGQGAFGFQVLRNKNLEIPLEPWYDYVIGINGRQVVCYSFLYLQPNACSRELGRLGPKLVCDRDSQLRRLKRGFDHLEC